VRVGPGVEAAEQRSETGISGKSCLSEASSFHAPVSRAAQGSRAATGIVDRHGAHRLSPHTAVERSFLTRKVAKRVQPMATRAHR
jgi:hypothetical protein